MHVCITDYLENKKRYENDAATTIRGFAKSNNNRHVLCIENSADIETDICEIS